MSVETLADQVHVRRRFQRSIHLERDGDNAAALEGYALTPQAREALQLLAEGLHSSSPLRALTITGPYGSGKSAFSLFVAALLSGQHPGGAAAWRELRQADPALDATLHRLLRNGAVEPQPLLPILITGRRASAAVCLLEGVDKALRAGPAHGPFNAVHKSVEAALARAPSDGGIDTASVIQVFQDLAEQAVVTKGCGGLLVIVDELGKLFEHAAQFPAQGDLFVLQELAELAARSGSYPILFLGVLHQAFDHYAHYVDEGTRQEWAKIQGRFTDVAFVEPPEQMLRLVAGAIDGSSSPMTAAATSHVRTIAAAGVEAGLCPPGMSPDEFVGLAVEVYPLHPTTFAALPYLFRRFAQNERSIFSYLASREPHGLQSFLQAPLKPGEHPPFIRLPDLFDYFVANLGAGLFRQYRSRLWAETLDALERAHTLEPIDRQLLKAVGLLSVLSEASHLTATEAIVTHAMFEADTAEPHLGTRLHSLRQRSLLTYRRYNQSFRLWEGSDVDVEERLVVGRRRTTDRATLTETVRRYLPQQPLIARRMASRSSLLLAKCISFARSCH
ncbi:MAG: hypothetical protein CL878_03870 [Dehalococcoidia bacterium]|nr:hypothetical protein [Dehalococcoidia bacterium]